MVSSLLCLRTHWRQDIDHSRLVLTAEAQEYVGKGSPEAQLFNAITPSGVPMGELKAEPLLAKTLVASLCRSLPYEANRLKRVVASSRPSCTYRLPLERLVT